MSASAMFDLAAAAVDAAVATGAAYTDARVVVSRQQYIAALNGDIEALQQSEAAGVNVRALIGSGWGFVATHELTEEAAVSAGRAATATAEASGRVPGPPLHLADVPVVSAAYTTPHDEDPFAVSPAEKCDLLVGVTTTMRSVAGVALARAAMSCWTTEKWFASSRGSRIHQRIVEAGGGIDATAVGADETQRRSYPQAFGQYETGGYELIRRWDWPSHAGTIAEEAVALLAAPQCPAGHTTLILEPSQLGLQIHESVGHATELDRILGWESAFAGTSFLSLDRLGSLRYGSPLMNVTADATLPGALATFAYDDEGTPAQRVDLVREGTWVGVLSGRDTAHMAGLPPGGMVRGDGYARLPMVRMTNVGLLPGDSSSDEMIADSGEGVLMATNRSWSIDDKRLNFQFGCEIGWEIKNGRRGRILRNPSYTGITPQFWGSLDRLGNASEIVAWGVPNCGKGQPMQVAHTGHPAPYGRFQDVEVGVRP